MSEKISVLHVSCEPDFSVVCRLLGEERTNLQEIKRIYDSELVRLHELVQPVVLMRKISADAFGNECGGSCVFEETMAQNKDDESAFLAVLITVGEDGEVYVRELFSHGEHLRALVADAMLSAWLFAMDKMVQDEIRAICDKRNVGVAQRMEAPDDIPLVKQNEICEALDAERLAGVRVTAAHMLVPEKSMCYVLQLCSDTEQFVVGHDCEKCGKKDCKMRRLTDVKDSKNSKNIIQILVEDQGKKCRCEAGSILMDTLREYGVRIDAPCGGSGRCGKCRVRVMSGELDVTPEDERFLSETEITDGVRLACTARPMADLRIRVLAKPGKKIAAVAEMSNVEDTHARQTERKNSDDAPKKAELGDTCEKAVTQNGVEPDKNGYGIGIDIGTTTLAACLYGWTDGTVLKTVTAVNSGRDFGADVLSRIEASCHGKRARLQELLQEDVCVLITQLLSQTGVQASDVKKIVIAANMTMIHLLMGYSCETLGRAPFVPANKRMICADAMRILGDNSLSCPVNILPAASAFVGGDIVSGMLSLGMNQGEDTVLLLDVGTNGEMALRHQGKIYVTSTAAGPAFEGGGISCGCASVPGAICSVKLNIREKNDFVSRDQGYHLTQAFHGENEAMIRTIADAAPVGICGSGVLELVSELLRVGYLDETGLFAGEYLENGFSLGKTVSGEPIIFTQGDVRALQLAKGAIRAGIEALLAAADLKAQEVKKVYLAGGFGVRMDEHAAIHIGLLPEKFAGRIYPAGNSSLSGTVYAGRREQLKQECEMLLEQCDVVVLAEQPEFEENYLRYLNF